MLTTAVIGKEQRREKRERERERERERYFSVLCGRGRAL